MLRVMKASAAHEISVQDNLALSLVHGNDVDRPSEARAPARARMGRAGNSLRDYTVFTVNAFINLAPHTSYFNRQYMVSGRFVDMVGLADPWVSQTAQEFREKETSSGRAVYMCLLEAGFFTVSTASCSKERLRCTGRTIPHEVPGKGGLPSQALPFYAVQCGVSSYVGPDPYHFAPTGEFERPYVCHGDSSLRPSWALLGFFGVSCGEREQLTYVAVGDAKPTETTSPE